MQSSILHIRLREIRRHCHPVSITTPLPDLTSIDWQAAYGDFYQLAAPVGAGIDTRFVVLQNETITFVVIRTPLPQTPDAHLSQTVEISFCPGDDGLTRWQYVLGGDGKISEYPYSPTDEVYSSKYRIPALSHSRVEILPGGYLAYTFGVPTSDLFSGQQPLGFHVGSTAGPAYHSWTYCSGNGGQDASSFGLLHPSPPAFRATLDTAQALGSTVLFSGQANSPLDLEFVDPHGRISSHQPETTPSGWRLLLEDKFVVLAGRYRVRLISRATPSEVIEIPLDLATRHSQATPFSLAVTNDPPMSLILAPYTPDRFDSEMRLLHSHGINRVHWIDFDPLLRHWDDPRWNAHIGKTLSACEGNLAGTAARAAHDHGVQLIADLKIFDMGANTFWNPGKNESAVEELDNQPFCVAPEIAANPHLACQLPSRTNPKATLPIRKLTIFSETPLDPIRPEEIRISVSDDNRHYQPYGGGFTLKQGQVERTHRKWTPCGLRDDIGARTNWFIELSGLSVEHAYLSIAAGERQATHRAFMLVEAIDAAGNAAALTLSTSKKDGAPVFWKEWLGWNNRIDPLFLSRTWSLTGLVMTFQFAPRMSALLEPTDSRSHDIWLAWIDRLLASGVDGVSIRTLCHHSSVESYLKYAWGPAVESAFEKKHRRAPDFSGPDNRGMREIRTEGYLEFLEKASTRVRNAGKIFNLQLESGFELDLEHQGRMQFTIPYREILRRRLVDEISFKWFTSENAWLHECVLPVARAQNIATQIISRNLSPIGHFDLPRTLPLLVGNAKLAGFQGYNLYELRDLLVKNAEYPALHPDAIAALKTCS